jgi:hypothetical protein
MSEPQGLDHVKTIRQIKDLPEYCCPHDAEFIGGDPNCEHDFVKQPEHDTFCSWKCSKCHMEIRIGVYQ